MEADRPDPPDVDALVEALRTKVAERRAQSVYPGGLEEDLESHFRRIAGHRSPVDADDLWARLQELEPKSIFHPELIPLDSRVPGGSALHRTVAKLVGRQTQGIFEQLQAFASGVHEMLRSMVAAIEDPAAHVHADLVGQLDAVFERLASYERGDGDTASVGGLRSRIEQLESAEAKRRFRPWFSSDRFENEFRGTKEQLKANYHDLAELLGLSSPVLDIGCGRGELLELLRDMGIKASGVEIDPELVSSATRNGLDVTLGDGLEVLASMDEESLGGLTLMQVVEHLTPQQNVELISLARDKLRPGGKMIIETVNPQSLYVFAHAFYADPTHTQPVHPAYLTFLLREAGFSEVYIDWRSPPPVEERLVEGGGGAELGGENIRRLNLLLFSPQDYAVIATR